MRTRLCGVIGRASADIRSIGIAIAVVSTSVDAIADDRRDYAQAQPLLRSGETVVGERIVYPSGAPAVDSLIVTMSPGEATGWHKHGVPTYAFMLAGQVTVDYDGAGRRTYRQGEAFLEAMDRWHNGVNDGAEPCRILVVFIGAAGQPAVLRRE